MTLATSPACDLHFSQKLLAPLHRVDNNQVDHNHFDNNQLDSDQLDHACATTLHPRHKCAQHTPVRAMAPTKPCPDRESLRAMKASNRSFALKMETADEALLRKAANITHKHLVETANRLGVTEGRQEHQKQITYNNGKIAAETIRNLEVKLLAETDEKSSLEVKFRIEQEAQRSLETENSSLREVVLDGQEARQHEAKKALDAAEEVKLAKSSIERLSKDLMGERQRAKETKRACREKDDAIRTLEQELEERDLELATERNKLDEATESIESLQEELKSQ